MNTVHETGEVGVVRLRHGGWGRGCNRSESTTRAWGSNNVNRSCRRLNRRQDASQPIGEVLFFRSGPIPIWDAHVGVIVMKCFFKQIQEDTVPRQQARTRVLHVHFTMNVDEVSKSAIAVEHVESTDVAGLLSFRQGGLIF